MNMFIQNEIKWLDNYSKVKNVTALVRQRTHFLCGNVKSVHPKKNNILLKPFPLLFLSLLNGFDFKILGVKE